SFKPKPLRYAVQAAGKACHLARSTTRLSLTLVLGRMSELTENYLRDLGFLLKEEWKASERALHESSSEQRQYEAGHNRAYRRVLSLMLQQAEAFDLPLSAICLEGIDRDKDLSC